MSNNNVIQLFARFRDPQTGAISEEIVEPSELISSAEDSSGGRVVYIRNTVGEHYISKITKKEKNGVLVPQKLCTTGLSATALERFHGILKLLDNQSIQITSTDGTSGTSLLIKRSISPASAFFIVKKSAEEVAFTDRVYVSVDLHGMRFGFSTTILDQDKESLALNLPIEVFRKVARSSTRQSGDKVSVLLNGQSSSEYKIKDLSTNGMALTVNKLSAEIGTKVDLEVTFNQKPGFKIQGLVVGHTVGTMHLSLNIHEEIRKDWTSCVLETQFPELKISHDPELAWKALTEFGYLDLLDTPDFREASNVCLNEWKKNEKNPNFFQPVVQKDSKLGGTYGIVQVLDGHWFQQCLATRIDPEYLKVTSALYSLWPQYIAATNSPTWITTQFDSEKKWHNRFFGVFANEVAHVPTFTRFVRHWFWSCKISPTTISKETRVLPHEEVSLEVSDTIHSIIKTYGSIEFSLLSTKTIRGIEHDISTKVVFDGPTFIGFIRFLQADRPLNPFSVFHVAHIFIANGDSSSRREWLKTLTVVAIDLIHSTGHKAGAITHDYDIEPDHGYLEEFEYFCGIEFQTHTEELIGEFLSVTALSCADMELRHATKI